MPTSCCRVERLEHLRADGVGGDAIEKLLGHVIGDVGLEERGADLGEALPHVGLGELAAAAQRLERGRERGGEGLEHGGLRVTATPTL